MMKIESKHKSKANKAIENNNPNISKSLNSDIYEFSIASDCKSENDKVFVVHKVNDDLFCSEGLQSDSKISEAFGANELHIEDGFDTNNFIDVLSPNVGKGVDKELKNNYFRGHHRKISSIAPLITQTDKYKDEYDMSQEDMIKNYISWKKNFGMDLDDTKGISFFYKILSQLHILEINYDKWSSESLQSFKPTPTKPSQDSLFNDESVYIEEEFNFDELPSFKLPKNLTISGTGRKLKRPRHSKTPNDTNSNNFDYQTRERFLFTSQSISPRPARTFI